MQDGIYGIVRHLLHTSVILVSLGWAFAWGSGWALVPAFLEVPFVAGKARREERRL